jgi:hypothetical protein
MEVDHGPFMVDNNLFLSKLNLVDMSQGGAYAHNLFAGKLSSTEEPKRKTPYHPAHTTSLAGLFTIKGGDNRFYNNIFSGLPGSSGDGPKKDDYHRRVTGYGLWVYDLREFPLLTGGNVFYRTALIYVKETGYCAQPDFDPQVKLGEENGQFILHAVFGPALKQAATKSVTTRLLGKARIPGLPYVNADDSSLKINTDYFGKQRTQAKPAPGPFANPGTGPFKARVWPAQPLKPS